MKKIISKLLSVTLILVLASCAVISEKPVAKTAYQQFTTRADYPTTMAVFIDENALNAESTGAASSEKFLQVDLPTQRVKLFYGDKVVLDAPCTTGKMGKETPTGTYAIKEKITDKRSNIFGSIYKNGKKVFGGDKRKYEGDFDKFVGSSMPYWQRLTFDGIGLHASNGIRRRPASNGCIRLPHPVAAKLYTLLDKGDSVKVTGQSSNQESKLALN